MYPARNNAETMAKKQGGEGQLLLMPRRQVLREVLDREFNKKVWYGVGCWQACEGYGLCVGSV